MVKVTDTYRCTRCGVLYEGYIGQTAFGMIKPDTVILMDGTKKDRVDLCPECMGALVKFLKGAQE